MLTQQALGKSYPDKFRVIKHKWNSLLFQGNEKEIPAHLCSISNLIALFFYSQAGKHRLFLNILLFGKLHSPILIQSVSPHLARWQVLLWKSFWFSNSFNIFIQHNPCLLVVDSSILYWKEPLPQTTHNTYFWEQELYRIIRSGNTELLAAYLADTSSISRLVEGKVANHPIRQAKNLFIGLITKIGMLAAISGGLDIEQTYQLIDWLIYMRGNVKH